MASRGSDPEHDPEAYAEAVRERYDPDRGAGVPADAVAVALDVSRRTAKRHLNGLVEDGDLEREPGGSGRGRPPWYYLPADG